MRNAFPPPVSSQLYNFGNNEVQPMQNLEDSMSMNNRVNVQGGSFYWESKVVNDGDLLTSGRFDIPHQSFINYQPVAGYPYTPSGSDNMMHQSILLGKKDFQATQMRKHSTEVTNELSQRRTGDPVESKTALREFEKNKRKKVNSFEEKLHHQCQEPINIEDLKAPVRRSQKLSDKITVLQKLVSPYGKTDTASVLQEASLYIRLLQEQIQNLFQMLSRSDSNGRALRQSQENDGTLLDLQSRGLCLVPISFMQKITEEDLVYPNSHFSWKFLA